MNVRAIIVVVGAVLPVIALSSCSRAADSVPADLEGDVATQRPVPAPSDLWAEEGSRLEAVWSVDLPALADAVMVGDVLGDGEPEIVVGSASEVRIYDVAGVERQLYAIPAPAAIYGFLSDIDGDRKADIVFGSSGDALSRVRVMNGQGEIVLEASGGSLVDGYTQPHFFADGSIYFTAGSSMWVTPRVTGRVEIDSGDLTWLRKDGVVPTGLAYSAALDQMTVHTVGVSRDLPDAQAVMATDPARSAVLVIDTDGEELLFKPLGQPLIEAAGGENQVTGVRSYPVTVDGESLVLVATDHGAVQHTGNAAVMLMNTDGEVLRRFEGPPASEARVGVQTDADGRLAAVAVVWSSTGVVEILDADLTPTAEVALPGNVHYAVIALVANLDGRGGPEYVIRDMDWLYVIGADGTLRAGTRFAGEVVDVALVDLGPGVIDDEPATGLVVLANDLHLVYPGSMLGETTVEDGGNAAEVVGGEKQRAAVTPGPASWAPIAASSSDDAEEFRSIAEAQLPEGTRVWGLDDTTGDGRPEAVVYSPAEGTVGVLETQLAVASVACLPERSLGVLLLDASTTPGGPRVCSLSQSDVVAAVAVDANGEVRYRTPLSRSQGARIRSYPPTSGVIPISVATGHPLWPRGVFALDAASGDLRFFYPTAGFAQRSAISNSVMFVGNYTPNNGHELLRDDSTVDRDDTMFLHAVTLDGEPVSWARPFPTESARGGLWFFAMDADGDGRPKMYAVTRRDPTYNPGVPAVYAIGEDGTVDLVVEGRENSGTVSWTVRIGQRDRLVTRWRPSEQVSVTGAPGDDVVWYDTPRESAEQFVNLDDDAAIEHIYVQEGIVVVAELGGTRRTEIRWPDQPATDVHVARDPVTGAGYLAVAGDRRVAVLRSTGAGKE